eukprot:m.167813 g.167813  ORF g.167813 m.167813 type:complete len:241 (-) comp16458_c0_seq6:1568-2290(-)
MTKKKFKSDTATISQTSEEVMSKPKPRRKVHTKNNRLPCPATLIVCPMSLVSQWEEECQVHLSNPRVLLYYGSKRKHNLLEALEDYDVIITTYGVVTAEGFRRTATSTGTNDYDEERGSSLFDFYFWRIILDEAHMIKNRNTVGAKACYGLSAERRWAMTGTPIQNHLQDVFSLLKFLRVEPWSAWPIWRAQIQSVFEQDEDKAVERLQVQILTPPCQAELPFLPPPFCLFLSLIIVSVQ